MKQTISLLAVCVFIFNAKINAQESDSSNPRLQISNKQNIDNISRVVNVKYPTDFGNQTTSKIEEYFRDTRMNQNGTLHVTGKAIIGLVSQVTGKDNNYRLAVDGKIVAKEVVVRIDNWADYVFTNNYRLMPLKDVKKYIELNQHLPGIDKANELETNGLNLGEMQKKQMEKTEELYLYVIQLYEQMEQLKAENTVLKKEMLQLKK